jgi:hypothetical protein
MSTAEVLIPPGNELDRDSDTQILADEPALELITIAGVSEERRVIISILLAKQSIVVPTQFLHSPDKGAMKEFKSADEFNAYMDTLSRDKTGKGRIEMIVHRLNKMADEILAASAQ